MPTKKPTGCFTTKFSTAMRTILLLHNPGAGDEDHSEDQLIARIQANGYACSYLSVKDEGWKSRMGEPELIVIAGGDGTVRKVANVLLNTLQKKPPVALLPMGTANNVARSLGIGTDVQALISNWKDAELKPIDAGLISNLPDTNFFLEGMGYGVFPELIKTMKAKPDKQTAGDELEQATRLLHKVTHEFEAIHCDIEADGKVFSGRYLAAEIMNMCSIGPNLHLAPGADPGDGLLELVLVPESKRKPFADYSQSDGGYDASPGIFQTVKVKSLRLECGAQLLHVDDKLIKREQSGPLGIRINPGALQFLI